MEAIPKSDIKSVIKSDISIKRTTWIGHNRVSHNYLDWAKYQIRHSSKSMYISDETDL